MSSVPASKRMSREDRRKNIVDHAVEYFAEYGLYADTRALAQQIGVTQAILYKHFPSKDALIEAVFQRLTEQQDLPGWQRIIQDDAETLVARLSRFFRQYATSTYTYVWIRLHMHSSLYDGQFNRDYIRKVTEPLLRTIAQEIRREMKFPESEITKVSDMEVELLWIFHYGLYYHPFREHVYGLEPSVAFDDLIEAGLPGTLYAIERYLHGLHPDLMPQPRGPRNRRRIG